MDVINQGALVGLPHMLAYRVNRDVGELMMTHGGNCLDRAIHNYKTVEERTHFAAEMLRQTIMALKTLHSIGYSHGDLKLQNMCVRTDSHGRLRFTLIDFGICQRLYQPGVNKESNSGFRGNLAYCTDQQLLHFRPTQFDDLISAVAMAYYMVNKFLPINIYVDQRR